MANDRQDDDVIDQETATALPKREAMSLIAPPPLSGILKAEPTDQMTTDQGMDESDPGTGA